MTLCHLGPHRIIYFSQVLWCTLHAYKHYWWLVSGENCESTFLYLAIEVLRYIVGCHWPWFMEQNTIGSHIKCGNFNSPPPSAAYMRRWTRSALVQVMAWRLSGTKPLPEPMLTYYQLDPWEQTPVKIESKYKKMLLKILSAKWQPFCLGGDELINTCILTVAYHC